MGIFSCKIIFHRDSWDIVVLFGLKWSLQYIFWYNLGMLLCTLFSLMELLLLLLYFKPQIYLLFFMWKVNFPNSVFFLLKHFINYFFFSPSYKILGLFSAFWAVALADASFLDQWSSRYSSYLGIRWIHPWLSGSHLFVHRQSLSVTQLGYQLVTGHPRHSPNCISPSVVNGQHIS